MNGYIVQLAAGGMSTLLLYSTGEVLRLNNNSDGFTLLLSHLLLLPPISLCTTLITLLVFKPIPELSKHEIVKLSCGLFDCVALSATGEVFRWLHSDAYGDTSVTQIKTLGDISVQQVDVSSID